MAAPWRRIELNSSSDTDTDTHTHTQDAKFEQQNEVLLLLLLQNREFFKLMYIWVLNKLPPVAVSLDLD